MRQAISEGISVCSLIVSALFGMIGAWGCPKPTWLHWGALGFLVVAGIFGSFSLWLARWWKPGRYTEIANQPFLNCDVLLDGRRYLACKFTNVTFVYNGGDAGGFDGECLFGGSLGFRTGEPKVGQMLAFIKELRLLKDGAFVQYTPKKR